jgi:N-acyl-D-amino-acid deacylase
MSRSGLAVLAGALALALLTTADGPGQGPKGKGKGSPLDFPISGVAGPGLEPLDGVVQELLDRHGIPGAVLALSKDGRLVLARGYGWMSLLPRIPMQPDNLLGLASVSKPITALAILKLIEQGKLKLDDRASDLLKHITPPPGTRVDARLRNVTVRQMLNHSGGWDRTRSGDPANWSPQISRALRVPPPLSPDQFLSFMLSIRLDFDPGAKAVYSNVGYVALGGIIEKASGQSYEDYVRKNVLEPAGVKTARLHTGHKTYFPNESGRFLPGSGVLMPPMQLPMVQAAGGWSASAVDVIRILSAMDGSRGKRLLSEKTYREMMAPPPAPIKPRKDGSWYGLGFHTVRPVGKGYRFFQDGSWHGIRAFAMHNDATGVNAVLIFNASMQPDVVDTAQFKDAVQEVRRHVEQVKDYPKVDFFKLFEK